MDGTRDLCNEPNCCGQSFIKEDNTSIIKEICYKSTITLYTVNNEETGKTEFWKFVCIESAEKLLAASVAALTTVILMN